MKRTLIGFALVVFLITCGMLEGKDRINDARALLEHALQPGADYNAISSRFRPTPADYKAYFNEDSWQTAMKGYEALWSKAGGFIRPKEGQTQLLIWGATTEEIRAGTGNASRFPGGYKKAVQHIRPGHTIYRFKFVRPGQTIGMAFDGLVFVNGHWVMFPKPWRIFR